MATNGSFNTPSYMDLSIKFEWSVKSQSVDNNSTVISWLIRGDRPSNITGMLTCGNFTVTINGATVYSTGRYNRVDVYNKTVIATGEATIPHNADGTKTFGVSVQAAIYYGEVNNSGSAQFTLPQIARASKPTLSANSVNFGSAITINTNRMSSSFTHALYYSLNDGAEAKIADGIDASYKWTVPYSLMSNIPSAKSATITLVLYTYNGSSVVGENTASFTANVPDNSTTKPSVSLNSLLPVSGLPSKFSSLYVQDKSKVQANVSSSGKYGATIKSCVMTVDGISYGEKQNYTSGYLTSHGEKTVTITATDSRGLSNSVSQKINVIAYSVPKINVSTCRRCDANGNLSDSGTYLKIVAQRTYSKVMSGNTQNNFCLIRYRYKASASASYSAWTTILARDSLSSDMVSTGALLGGVLAVSASYQVQIQALDDIGEYSETTINIETETVHTHKAPKGIGFGKYSEVDNALDLGWNIELNENDIYKNGVKAFAPDGYGLGSTSGKWCEDANTATKTGFYIMSGSSAKNTPANHNGFKYGVLQVQCRSTNYIYQTLTSADGFANVQMVTRYSTNSGATWSEWEWINPPMTAGVEYRTTERCDGKPVYRKLVVYTHSGKFGDSATNTDYTIPHGISGWARSVRCVTSINYDVTGSYLGSAGGILHVNGFGATNINVRVYKTYFNSPIFRFDLAYIKE